ncbi:MAG: hypothetical protein L3J69_13970 [Desulfobacula sp.]|nr:hypothetical protein [Desulfobacula sp.]
MATINDVILIHLEDTPVSFARVESILPDAKKDWYQIKLLMLRIPLQVITWTLKDDYINGMEFHMNGKRMKLTTVECPIEELQMALPSTGIDQDQTKNDMKAGVSENKDKDNIISFSDFKKDS